MGAAGWASRFVTWCFRNFWWFAPAVHRHGRLCALWRALLMMSPPWKPRSLQAHYSAASPISRGPPPAYYSAPRLILGPRQHNSKNPRSSLLRAIFCIFFETSD